MNEVQLEVAKAYPNDSGRGIARLDPDTLLHLKLSPGDIIEIEGAETTAAKVWRADRQDWNTDTVRVDGFTRQNADVGIGERVTIRKAEAEKAEKLVLAPPERRRPSSSAPTPAGMVKRQILKRPVVERDIVPVMSSTNHPFMRSPGQAIPLIAVDTEPDGVCLITEDTEVELREEPISGFEKTGSGITYEDIGGLQSEIQRVREMVELPMKHPQIFSKLGIEPPQGVLLHGPPGTGKDPAREGGRQRDERVVLLDRRPGDHLEVLRRVRTAAPRDLRGRERGEPEHHLHRRARLDRAEARGRDRRRG